MRYRHANPTLQWMDDDPDDDGGYSAAIADSFRRRMNQIRQARDERDLYALKSLRFEKLKGRRQHQRSMRLNDQFRLILEIEPQSGGNVIVVVGIEDYH